MIKIKKATLDDCRLIHEMAWKVFPLTYKDIITPAQSDFMMEWMYSLDNLKKQMTEEQHTYLLAYEGDTPKGYVSVQPQAEDLWHLQKINVLPEYQKEHIGKKLFESALNYIKEQHPAPCMVELNVNRNNVAVGFYEHMGMHKVRTEDNDIGDGFFMNDYVMGKEI